MKKFARQILNQTFEERLLLIQRGIIIIFVCILIRSLYLQTVGYQKFSEIAERQNRTQQIRVLRGSIYDTENNLLAASLPLQSLYINPKEIDRPIETSNILSVLLNIPKNELIKKINASKSFVWIKKQLLPKDVEKVKQYIKKNELSGIYFLQDYKRVYPAFHFASHILGYKGTSKSGSAGLEYQYDSILESSDKNEDLTVYPIQGENLKTTLHELTQYYVEKELYHVLRHMNAVSATGIVMESKTGAILAMSTVPDYNPNKYLNFKHRWYNRAIGDSYEPGSTFKLITVATALENKKITPDQLINCENGVYKIQDRVIHDTYAYSWLNLEQIIQKSSNICAAKIGLKIPKKVFYDSIQNFGFKKRTGIGLAGEQKGILHHYEKWSKMHMVTLSYGYGISVTPIQLISAINTFANNGTYIPPYIIKDRILEKNTHKKNKRGNNIIQKKQQILDPNVVEKIKQYMVSVTQKGGTGSYAHINGIQIAGKTGTTRKLNLNTGKYSNSKHILSFVGFLPAEDPIITILVIINEPHEDYDGVKSAAPTFKKIVKKIMPIYGIHLDTEMIALRKKIPENMILSSQDSIFKVGDKQEQKQDPSLRKLLQKITAP